MLGPRGDIYVVCFSIYLPRCLEILELGKEGRVIERVESFEVTAFYLFIIEKEGEEEVSRVRRG
jgi:hypothetical protein